MLIVSKQESNILHNTSCRLLPVLIYGSSSWWRHKMETFFALLALCAGNSLVTGNFPSHKGQWHGALMFSLICAWINRWVNNRQAGDLRRHRAHYDVNVIWTDAWWSDIVRTTPCSHQFNCRCFNIRKHSAESEAICEDYGARSRYLGQG